MLGVPLHLHVPDLSKAALANAMVEGEVVLLDYDGLLLFVQAVFRFELTISHIE
jgi:hypothetical protein